MSNQLFEKSYQLYNTPAASLTNLFQPNIDMINGIVAKYTDLDLTKATEAAWAVISGGQNPSNAVNTAAVFVKAQAKTQGYVMPDGDANVIAQSVTTWVLNSIEKIVTEQPQQLAA